MYTPLTKEKMDELEERIDDFFSENSLKHDCGTDISQVCNQLGIQVYGLKFNDEISDEIDGVILVKDGKKMIGINEKLEPKDARFVIGHELSHYITQSTNQRENFKYAFKDKIFHGEEKTILEQEMDFMSAAILVPKKQMKEYLKIFKIEGKSDIKSAKQVNSLIIDLLADKFNVNTDVIYRRIVEVS